MCNCDKSCGCQSNKSSGFIFGLIFGAIIGAIIAVVIYKNNKTKIFEDLKNKLNSFFGKSPKKETKKEEKIFIPKIIKKPKTFLKPKKR